MPDNWNRRDKGMLCSTCISYVPKLPPPNYGVVREVGRCRKHAPTHAGFPVVFPTDWCGDHRLDENKVQAEEAPMCHDTWHVLAASDVSVCPSCQADF